LHDLSAIAGFHVPRSTLFLILLSLVLLGCSRTACAEATGEGGLRGTWQSLDDESGRWTAFDPTRLERIPRQSAPARVRLWVEGEAPVGEPMLVVRNPGMERFEWVSPRSGELVRAALLDVHRVGWLGHGRIAVELETLPRSHAPFEFVLAQQSAVNGRIAFRIGSRSEVLAADAAWIALVSTCLALLAGMALIALVFFVKMRDRTFLYYAGYLLAYALVQLIQTGFAGSPLGWSWVADAPREWGRAAVVVSIVTSVLFLIHFAQVKRFLPAAMPWLRGYVVLVSVLGVLGFVPWTVAALGAAGLANPLILFGGPLVLAVAWFSWRRGSRYAGFFLVGWTPLLLLTVAGSLQVYGLWPGWFLATETAIVAAAFEAMVLSAGLADRAASAGRQRDEALVQASHDALTGALNRRAFEEKLATVLQVRGRGEPVSLLFADLDGFKQLNDALGHVQGDIVLQAVAGAIKAEMRSGDAVARMGGDEFVVVLPGATGQEAQVVGERVRRAIAALGPDAGTSRPYSPSISVSIGIATTHDDETASHLLERADQAMYAVKRSGGNRVKAARTAPIGRDALA
jgi:diguanylate cyclase (GGDEF)-like protein